MPPMKIQAQQVKECCAVVDAVDNSADPGCVTGLVAGDPRMRNNRGSATLSCHLMNSWIPQPCQRYDVCVLACAGGNYIFHSCSLQYIITADPTLEGGCSLDFFGNVCRP